MTLTTAATGCRSNCAHLWVSRDGGASWHQVAATGWDGGRPIIAVDARGHDVLYSGSGNALVKSDDWGGTWTRVGGGGTPTAAPSYATDGTVATAAVQGGDYLLTSSGTQAVTGSGGSANDMSFMYAPSFPSAGVYPPVLLTAEDRAQRLPLIQQCSASLACTGATRLPGAVFFSSPVTLLPSTTYAGDGTVFAQSGRGIYKSRNGGIAFTQLTIGDPTATATATPMLALAPKYSEQSSARSAWAAVFQIFEDKAAPQKSHSSGGIYRTDDGGTTWHAVGSPGPLDHGAQSVAVGSNGRLFAGYLGTPGGYEGLLCSDDGGSTWHATCPKVGNAANDPGASAATRSQSCKSGCSSAAPGSVATSTAKASNGSHAVGGVAGASSGGASGAAGETSSAMAAASRRGWPFIVAFALALAAVVGAVVRRRRGTRGAEE